MNRTLTPEEAQAFETLEGFAREIEAAESNLFRAALEAPIKDSTKLKILDALQKCRTSGLAYQLHVQHEWTGGDSLDPANFRATAPHIDR